MAAIPPTNKAPRNVWVINTDGSGALPLTKLTTAAGMVSPFTLAWSLDGNKIAFESFRALDGSDTVNQNLIVNIWIVNPDGSGVHPVTKNTAVGTDCLRPAWSPDGNQLAFFSFRALDGSNSANMNNTENIWVVSPDGSSLVPVTKLTAQGAEASEPIWRP